MIENFISEYAKLLSFKPEYVKVEVKDFSANEAEIVIFAHKEDAGKLIGKDGNMIKSIKTFINGCKAKEPKNYKISVNLHE